MTIETAITYKHGRAYARISSSGAPSFVSCEVFGLLRTVENPTQFLEELYGAAKDLETVLAESKAVSAGKP